jgi:hypothetical protein
MPFTFSKIQYSKRLAAVNALFMYNLLSLLLAIFQASNTQP